MASYAFGQGVAKPLPKTEPPQLQQPVKIEVAEDGALRMDEATSIAYADKGVVLTYGEFRLTADHVRYNTMTHDAWAEGNVHLYRPGAEWLGESLYYNFDTQKTIFGKFRMFVYPWVIRGEKADKVGPKYVIKNGFVTTCDYEQPHWGLRARTVEFYPNEKIIGRGVQPVIGGTPFFYYPYFNQSLKKEKQGFEFVPGANSRFGPYLLTTYNWVDGEELRGAVHADYRLRRGFAGGFDVDYRDPRFGKGELKTYFLYDNKPNGQTVRVPSPGLDEENVRHERYRISYRDQTPLREDIMLKVDLHKQSDSRIIEDFFRTEYRRDVQPDNVVEISKYDPGYGLSMMARPQLNSFFTTTERMPDLALDIKRQQLFGSPLYYQGELSVAHLQRKYSNLLSPEPDDFNAVRFDWLHQILYPQQYFGWLSVVPRIGIRETWYNRTPMSGSVTNYVGGGSQATRWMFPMGLETSFKVSRVYDINNAFWDVHGLRHIAQPVVDFNYVPGPNARPQDLYQFDTTGRFDRNYRTTRLLPNDAPSFDQIDALDRMETLRAGIRNKLQTKRDGQTVDFINLNIYGEWRGHRESALPSRKSFSDVYAELESQPLSWMAFDLDSRVSTSGELNELNAGIRFLKAHQWEIGLSKRYIRDTEGFFFGNSDLYSLMTHWTITENWAVRTIHSFEAATGTLEEQEYSLIRDLHDWEVSLNLRQLKNHGHGNEVDAFVAFRLKAFPGTSLDLGY